MNIKIGQVYVLNERWRNQVWPEKITISYVGNDYFTYKEDNQNLSWLFTLLESFYHLQTKE